MDVQLRVPPYTTEQNMSQNGLQEYVFMEFWWGGRFEALEAPGGIHTSIHPGSLWERLGASGNSWDLWELLGASGRSWGTSRNSWGVSGSSWVGALDDLKANIDFE